MSMSGSLLEHAANGGSSFPGLEAARASRGMAMPGQKPGQAAPIKLEGELPYKQPVRGTCCTDRQVLVCVVLYLLHLLEQHPGTPR